MLPRADVSSRFGLSAFFSSSRFFSAGVCSHSHYTLSCLCPVAQSVQLSPIDRSIRFGAFALIYA